MANELQEYIDTGDTFNDTLASAKYDTQMGIASQVLGAATATVVDGGVSIYNSLMPMLGADEVQTGDILRKVSRDASVMYEENPEAIQTASLIGTSFLPMGLALKGMNMLRQGAKGVSWFSNAGRTDNLNKINQAVLDGLEGTKTMRSLNRTMLRNGIANNLLDTAVTEAAMLTAMNSHPLLEDYWDDPVKNMGLSLAFGGVIGSGIGHIADRAAIKAIKGSAMKGVVDDVFKNIEAPAPADPNLGKIQTIDANIKSLERLVSPDFNANTATKQLASFVLEEQKVVKDRLMTEASSGAFKDLPLADKNYFMDLITKNPEFGLASLADGVKFATLPERVVRKSTNAKVGVASLVNTAKRIFDDKTNELVEVTDAIYLPERKAFVEPEQLQDFARASIAYDKDTIKGIDTGKLGYAPRNDMGLIVSTGSSPEVDAAYLSTLHKVSTAKLKDINLLDEADLPAMDAIIARAMKTPDEFTNKTFQFLKDPYGKKSLELNIAGKTPDTRRYSVEELKDIALARKEVVIDSMLKSKPLEYIAIHTNLPYDTVATYAMGKAGNATLKELQAQGYGMMHYKDADALEEYLSVRTKPLRIKHSANKATYADMLSSLDNKTMSNINMEFISNTLNSSKSDLMRSVADSILGNEADPQGMRPLIEMLRNGMGELTNDKLGNPFLQSADFFLRDSGVGKVVSYIGKTIQDTATRKSTELVTPVAQAMSNVVNDVAKRTEALNLFNVLDGMAGWRDIVDGTVVHMIDEVDEVTGKSVKKIVPYLVDGRPFSIKSESVKTLVDEMRKAGREMFEAKATTNRITGRAAPNDLGFWMPSIDFRNKHLAYVFNRNTQKTSVIWGSSPEALKTNIMDYMAATGLKEGEEIITKEAIEGAQGGIVIKTKAQQEQWNILNGRNDSLTMQVANVQKYKTGSAQDAILKLTPERFSEIIGGYENLVESYTKRTASYIMSDVLDRLDTLSNYNQKYSSNQPLDSVFKFMKKSEDGAAKVRNILLGNSNLSQYTPWQHANENFEITVNYGLDTIGKALNSVLEPLSGTFGKKSKLNAQNLEKMDYKAFSDKLEAAGVVNPFAAYDNHMAQTLYNTSKLHEAKDVAKRLVYAGNAFAATAALRFMDIASPLVNAMSMPILMTLAKAQNLPPSLMGAVRAKGGIPPVASLMHEGVRLSNSEHGKTLSAMWEKQGHYTSFVTEANKAMRMTREFTSDSASKLEGIVNNSFVDMMSKPADYVETLTRRTMMFTGYALAKKMYPTMGDTAATVFARDFMDRAVGNYHSGQRPVVFQGTMGVAMGLFQTYMLTLAQNIYRGLELKDYKTLGKAMLAQSTIFGAGSLPGFDIISTAIADNFSEENIDLTTGTFRALPDPMATAIIYGLPSSAGPALYTRGDISPRIPSPTDITALAAVNLVGQTLDFGANLAKATANNGGNIPNAMMQALSLQSVSRPLARWSELVTGYSVSKYGDIYATPDEVRDTTNWMGIGARLIGARPIEEAKAREGLFLGKNYDRIDREHRMKVTNELKLAVRAGTLDDAKLEELAERFASKSGSASAWRKAVNDAIANNNLDGKEIILNKLRPDSPVMHMMDLRDGEAVE